MAVKPEFSVEIDLKEVKAFELAIRNANHPAMIGMLKQWAALYRSFSQRRFARFSRGGGDWPPLALSTQRQRRGARRGRAGSRVFAILRDTGILFAGLDPKVSIRPGQLERRRRLSVQVGYGGSALHSGAKITIARLAEIHDRGLGRVPVRQIIVVPDVITRRRMERSATKKIDQLARSLGQK